jgi:hypothetical protein
MTEEQIRKAFSSFEGWFKLDARTQKELFGYSLLGRPKHLLAKDAGLWVSYTAGYGQEKHEEYWPYAVLAELTKERKRIYRRIN